MKIIMLTLCFIINLLQSANAMELYRCLDNNGNEIITSAPQDWMRNCVLKESYDDSEVEESAQQQSGYQGSRNQESRTGSDNGGTQSDKKLRQKCAQLDNYRKEAKTYCSGVPQSYKGDNEAMKKTAQDRMASSSASANRNCDYYSGLVRELEAKCR